MKDDNILDAELKFRSDALVSAMSTYSNISTQRLLSKSRLAPIVEARSCVIYTLIQSGFSFVEVGKVFSKNYSTIVYNYHQLKNRLTNDENNSKKIISVLKYLREVNNSLTEKVKEQNGEANT